MGQMQHWSFCFVSFFVFPFNFIFLAEINIMIKSNLGKKGFILSPIQGHSQSLREVSQELKAGTWRQELKQRTRRNTTYWFVPLAHAQPVFLHNLEVTLPTVSWAFPTLSSNQRIAPTDTAMG